MSRPTRSAVRLPGGSSPRGVGWVVPRGRHGHPRAEIEAIQRARLLDAFVEEVGRIGLAGTYVAKVCTAAGVSTKEFYNIFGGKDDCFLVAFEAGAQLVCDQGASAFARAEGRWEHRVRAAIHAMLEILAANPAFCRLCIVEVHHAGPGASARLAIVVRRCRQAFGGYEPPELPPGLSAAAYESSLVGASCRPLTDYVTAGKVARLTELVPVLTYSLVLPVVGRERAERQLHPSAG